MRKIDIYHNLKREVKDTEKAYDKALERFEGLITAINRNLINGNPQNNQPLKLFINSYTADLTKANLMFLLANKKLHDFLDNGVINNGR